MPGPAQKHPGKRVRKTRTRSIGVVHSAGVAPLMPWNLCKPAQAAWRSYFADAVSGVLREADTPIVVRWVRNLDRYHRLLAEADSEPIVAGSTGQPKPNPLYDMAYRIEASIRVDEAQLGIGPLSRLRLGAQLSESAKTLAQLNTEAASNATEDPRAALTVVARDSS